MNKPGVNGTNMDLPDAIEKLRGQLDAVGKRIDDLDVDDLRTGLNDITKQLEDLDKQTISSAKERAEVEQINADTERLGLEAEKLRGNVYTRLRDQFGGTLMVVSLLVTVIVSTTSFYQQQEKLNQFEITKDVITLVDRINTSTDESYPILLSTLGEHAVPILVVALNKTAAPKFTDGVITAMTLIAKDDKDAAEKLATALDTRVEMIAKQVVINERRKIDDLLVHVRALGAIRLVTGAGGANERLKNLNGMFHCTDRGTSGAAVSPLKVTPPNRTTICKEIGNASS